MQTDTFWKFIREKELTKERALGRDHFWHYTPELTPGADSCMVKVIMQPGDGHDFHRHPQMHEILYFLAGQAEQWIEDRMEILGPGDSIFVAPDVIHATFNAGKESLEFLAVLSPASGWKAGTIDMSTIEPYASYRTNPLKE